MTDRRSDVAGIVLAAGAGRRLRPLTDLRPKALCPVGGRPLLDLAMERLVPVTGSGADHIAVNAHHHAEAIVGHVGRRATVSVEQPEALGTAGGVAALKDWLDGRHALVTNADAYLEGVSLGSALTRLLAGWDGEHCRLLCRRVAGGGDFSGLRAGLRYVGVCVLPRSAIRELKPTPSGLYEVLWRDAAARNGGLDLMPLDDPEIVAIDCGTPADYLAANLHASGGRSVVAENATVLGRIERCVVWDGAWVEHDEDLQDAVRAGSREDPITVHAG